MGFSEKLMYLQQDLSLACIQLVCLCNLQEQPPFEKKALGGYLKKYIAEITKNVPEADQAEFKKNISEAAKFLISKLKDLQL